MRFCFPCLYLAQFDTEFYFPPLWNPQGNTDTGNIGTLGVPIVSPATAAFTQGIGNSRNVAIGTDCCKLEAPTLSPD